MRRAIMAAIIMMAVIGLLASTGICGPIVLKGITAFPKNHLANDPVPIFIDKVNQRSGGKLKIDWIGGPEVVKSFDQVHALKSGMIDIILYCPFPYMKSLLPVAEAKALSQLAQWEERASGAFDLMSEILAKRVNGKYLGSPHSYVGYHIYTNKKITQLADFKGVKIRAQPLYVPLLEALGATPVSMPAPEIYTAMERGVVDGFMWPKVGMISWGLHEITKYVVEPSILRMGSCTVMNLDKWNKLPKELQDTVMDVMKDVEYIGAMRNIMIAEYEDGVRRNAGMQFVKLPPEDAKKLEALAYEKTWAEVIKDAPEDGPKLRKLSSKEALPKGTFPWQ